MTTWDQPEWVKSQVLQLVFLTSIQSRRLIRLGQLADSYEWACRILKEFQQSSIVIKLTLLQYLLPLPNTNLFS